VFRIDRILMMMIQIHNRQISVFVNTIL